MKPIDIFMTGAIAKMACYELTLGTQYDVCAFAVNREFRQSDSLLDRPLDAAFASQALRSRATLLGFSSVPCAIYLDT